MKHRVETVLRGKRVVYQILGNFPHFFAYFYDFLPFILHIIYSNQYNPFCVAGYISFCMEGEPWLGWAVAGLFKLLGGTVSKGSRHASSRSP
jgi:hypothetical protein